MSVRFASYILPLLLLLAACSSQPSKVDEPPEQLVDTPPKEDATETSSDEEKEEEITDAGLESLFKRGLVLMKSKRYESAQDLWLAASERYPDYAGVWTNLGLSQYYLENYEEAKNSLSKSIEINPQFCSAHKTMGLVLRELGDFKGAEESYISAIECAPKDGNVRRNLGILYDLYLLDGRRALEQYEAAKKLYFAKDKNLEIWINNLKAKYPDPKPEESVAPEQAPEDGNGVENGSDQSVLSDTNGVAPDENSSTTDAQAEVETVATDSAEESETVSEQGASE